MKTPEEEDKELKELQKLAWKECCALWKAMAITGYPSKEQGIKWAFERGWLKRSQYFLHCPFCDYLGCYKCLWPVSPDSSGKCTANNSPYMNWSENATYCVSIKNKKLASEMYKFIKAIGEHLDD